MTRSRAIRVAAIVASWALGSACSRPRAATIEQDAVPTVAVQKVTRGDVMQVVTVAAEFRPFQEIEVHAKVAGYVQSIYVDVGDRVRAGQLLAVLEVPEMQDDLRENEAATSRAQEEVNRAQADLERAQSAHEVVHLAAERLGGVLKVRPNLVAQQDIDEATGRDRVAEAQVATAKATLASAQQQIEVARASRSRTQTLLDYARITAPFAGVITQRYADTGAMIQAGTSSQTQAMPIVRLSQNDRLRLVIPVPESAVPRVGLGHTVDVAVQSLHRTVTGTVARFADRLNPDTRTMRVEVDVPNPDLELVPGMYADASLVLDAAKGVLVAPIEAIDRSESSARALTVGPDGRLDWHAVTLGLETSDRVEIKAGLSDGDVIVIGSRGQLKPGEIVVPKLVAASEGAR